MQRDPTIANNLGNLLGRSGATCATGALDRVARLLATEPDWPDGHRALSAALWEGGARAHFTASYQAALAPRPRDPPLRKGYIEALGKVGLFADAADICTQAASATIDPTFLASAFSYWSAAGEMTKPDGLLAGLPSDALSRDTDEALSPAERPRRRRIIAGAGYERRHRGMGAAWCRMATAWDRRFEWLNCQDGLIQVQDLPLSATDIADIAARLRMIHVHSRLRAGQSLRGGTQTGGDLFDRREPEIKTLDIVLRHAVERYRLAMPPADPRHPLLEHRDSRFVIAGSWSIRLIDGGFHVQHVHPKA